MMLCTSHFEGLVRNNPGSLSQGNAPAASASTWPLMRGTFIRNRAQAPLHAQSLESPEATKLALLAAQGLQDYSVTRVPVRRGAACSPEAAVSAR